jgi:hypothetical protein
LQEEREFARIVKVLADALQYLHDIDVPQGEPRKASFSNWYTVLMDIDEFDDPTRLDVFYSRAMLMDCRVRIGKLDSSSFLALRNQHFAAPVIEKVVAAILSLFVADSSSLQVWNTSKTYLSTHLIKLAVMFDPTASESIESVQLANKMLEGITFAAVRDAKSPAVLTLYYWFLVVSQLADLASTFAKRRPRLRVRKLSMSRSASGNAPPAIAEESHHDHLQVASAGDFVAPTSPRTDANQTIVLAVPSEHDTESGRPDSAHVHVVEVAEPEAAPQEAPSQ